MYMSWLISFVLADSRCEASYESEKLQNKKKILTTVGPDPLTSRLLDWHSNQLRHGIVWTVKIYK